MQKTLSIKGNIISFDENSKFKDISEIILNRFGNEEFVLKSSLKDLHNPYLLKDMDKAVERIKKARENDEKVMIFGDYDVDGITATSLLMHFLTKIGLKISYRLPDRVKNGYGLKNYFIDELAGIGVNLIITVDCGIRDDKIVQYATEKGIDVIITDHHDVPEIIPQTAIAVINSKRIDCPYPYKNLAGVGIAFKLLHALGKEFLEKEELEKYLQNSIDIVAIGTVTDCMELTGENRIIVQNGLKQVKNSRSLGIKKLTETKLNEELDADFFAFSIGPKLNVAGRLDSPYKAVNLILNNGKEILKNVLEIEQLNEKRKYLTEQFYNDALTKINIKDNILFYISKDIDHGIVGIVAGRLCTNFNKPCICLKDEGDKLTASCRCPEYFSIIEFLEKYKDFFLTFGGHKQAAGFSISKDKFGELKSDISKEVSKLNFSEYKKEMKVNKIITLEEIGFSVINKMNEFKPFGIGNEKPIFMIEDLEYSTLEFIGNDRKHLKFNNKYGFKILAFNFGEFYEDIKKSRNGVNIIFDLLEDNWNGNKNILLKILDVVLR